MGHLRRVNLHPAGAIQKIAPAWSVELEACESTFEEASGLEISDPELAATVIGAASTAGQVPCRVVCPNEWNIGDI